MHWKCPNCNENVDFREQMDSVFENGEADFNPENGLVFHTINCKCGVYWTVSISEMERS